MTAARLGVSFVVLCCLPMFAQTRKATTPVLPGHLHTPFDPTSVRLTAHFMGHDVVSLYKDYEAIRTAEKTEFETTDQFNKRIQLARTKVVMGSVAEATILAFVVPVESEYDADARSLTVGVQCSNPHGEQKKVSDSIGVSRRTTHREYVASNAFGVKVNVQETDVESFHIAVDNPDDFPIATAKYLILSSIESAPDPARKIKSTVSALAVCSIQSGEEATSDDFILSKATFDDPHEYFEQMHFLKTKLLAVWFFDSTSGKIYAKVETNK